MRSQQLQWTAEAVRARAIIRVQANTADPAAEAVDREAAEDEVTAAAVEETKGVPQMTHSSMMMLLTRLTPCIRMEKTTFNTL